MEYPPRSCRVLLPPNRTSYTRSTWIVGHDGVRTTNHPYSNTQTTPENSRNECCAATAEGATGRWIDTKLKYIWWHGSDSSLGGCSCLYLPEGFVLHLRVIIFLSTYRTFPRRSLHTSYRRCPPHTACTSPLLSTRRNTTTRTEGPSKERPLRCSARSISGGPKDGRTRVEWKVNSAAKHVLQL